MPDHSVPLRSNGDPLVTVPARGDGGAHALREASPLPVDGPASDSGQGLLTSTRVLVTAPRHRIEKRTPFLFVIEGIWSWAILAGLLASRSPELTVQEALSRPLFLQVGAAEPTVLFARGAVVPAEHSEPVTLRKRWDPNPARKLLYGWVEGLPAWQQRPQGETGRLRRGVGVAAAGWMYFVQPSAQVRVDASAAGIVVSTACQDVGNGTRTLLAKVVGDVLGVAPAGLRIEIGDSRLVPGPTAGGSRTTASIVPAARMAAELLREELVARVVAERGVAGVAGPGGVRHPGGLVPWAEVLAAVKEPITARISSWRRPCASSLPG